MKHKVAIYLRKSTDSEDSQALSLQKQRDACDELLRTLGDYEIVRTWEESISAKQTGQRPGFREMLKMIDKGQIDTLIVWKLSRVARNSLDQAYIETYLQEGKLRMILSQDGVFRPEDNILLMRIYFSMATQYSRDLGKDASQGMLTKVKSGQPVKVPRGYEFDKHKNAVPTHEISAIREIFRLKRLGYSLGEISGIVFQSHGFSHRGKAVPTSTIHHIITNPMYYGAIRYMGEIYEGTFQPMVSFSDWTEANATSGVQREENPGVDFARNLVFNHESGNALCPFLSKGCLYFRSTERDGPKINIAFSKIIKYFQANIHRYQIPEEYRGYIIEGFREFCISKHGDIAESKKNIQQEMNKIDKKRANLLDMRMGGELDSEEYKTLKNELSDRYFSMAEQLQNFDNLNNDILEKGELCFKLLTNLSQQWNSANLIRYAPLLKLVCFRVSVDKEKALHLEERELFREVRNLNDTVWLSRLDNPQTPLTMLYTCMIHFVRAGGCELTRGAIDPA